MQGRHCLDNVTAVLAAVCSQPFLRLRSGVSPYHRPLDLNSFTTFTAAVLFLIAKHVMSSTNSTLVEVMLLVTINVILDDLSQYTAYAYNMDKVFILFIYVIAIHSIKNAMPTPKK